MPIPALFLGLAAAQGAKGLYDMITGRQDLDALHRQKFPEYSEVPEQQQARLRAQEMSKRGFTPEEVAARDQRLIRSENTGFQKGMNVAPGQSQALLSAANYSNAIGQNNFAAQDANLHRQNIAYSDKLTSQLQNLSNMNIQAQQRNRLMAETALGRGIADSRDRLFGAGNTLIASYAYGQGNPATPPQGMKPQTISGVPLNPNAIPSQGAQNPADNNAFDYSFYGSKIPQQYSLLNPNYGAPYRNPQIPNEQY